MEDAVAEQQDAPHAVTNPVDARMATRGTDRVKDRWNVAREVIVEVKAMAVWNLARTVATELGKKAVEAVRCEIARERAPGVIESDRPRSEPVLEHHGAARR